MIFEVSWLLYFICRPVNSRRVQREQEKKYRGIRGIVQEGKKGRVQGYKGKSTRRDKVKSTGGQGEEYRGTRVRVQEGTRWRVQGAKKKSTRGQEEEYRGTRRRVQGDKRKSTGGQEEEYRGTRRRIQGDKKKSTGGQEEEYRMTGWLGLMIIKDIQGVYLRGVYGVIGLGDILSGNIVDIHYYLSFKISIYQSLKYLSIYLTYHLSIYLAIIFVLVYLIIFICILYLYICLSLVTGRWGTF